MHFIEFIALFVSGFIASSYGSVVGGGSLVSFPTLILLGLPTPIAIGTNRLFALFADASSTHAYWGKNLLQLKYSLVLGLIAIPASVLGARTTILISLTTINTIIAIGLFLLLFLLPKIHQIKPDKNKTVSEIRVKSKKFVIMALSTLVLAFYGGFYGAGFGTFIMFPFIFLGGSTLLQASANARFVGVLMSAAASVVFIKLGFVNYAYALPLILGGLIGAQLGVRVAVIADSKVIKFTLYAVVILSAAKLLVDAY